MKRSEYRRLEEELTEKALREEIEEAERTEVRSARRSHDVPAAPVSS
jgi:hypothetical protein